jgi:putative transcriptional regulator
MQLFKKIFIFGIYRVQYDYNDVEVIEMKKVRINLHRLMGERKIRSINQLSKDTGITRTTLTRLYNEESTQLDFNTIGTLCEYFQCDLSELLFLEEEK